VELLASLVAIRIHLGAESIIRHILPEVHAHTDLFFARELGILMRERNP